MKNGTNNKGISLIQIATDKIQPDSIRTFLQGDFDFTRKEMLRTTKNNAKISLWPLLLKTSRTKGLNQSNT